MKAKSEKLVERFSYSAAADVRRLLSRYWPNDCPACGARMEFRFNPVVRVCSCGRVVTESEALKVEA